MGLIRRKKDDQPTTAAPSEAPPTGAEPPAWWTPETSAAMPDPLADLAMFTLDHALDSIELGGPLIPLVLADTAAGRQGHRFMAGTLEDGLAQARAFVGQNTAWRRAALAFDGYLTNAEGRRDAIYVLGWDRDSGAAVKVAHVYVPGQETQPLQRLGDPLFLGAPPAPGE
jgi:hypothetical protein